MDAMKWICRRLGFLQKSHRKYLNEIIDLREVVCFSTWKRERKVIRKLALYTGYLTLHKNNLCSKISITEAYLTF